jgi:hypothetical protein
MQGARRCFQIRRRHEPRSLDALHGEGCRRRHRGDALGESSFRAAAAPARTGVCNGRVAELSVNCSLGCSLRVGDPARWADGALPIRMKAQHRSAALSRARRLIVECSVAVRLAAQRPIVRATDQPWSDPYWDVIHGPPSCRSPCKACAISASLSCEPIVHWAAVEGLTFGTLRARRASDPYASAASCRRNFEITSLGRGLLGLRSTGRTSTGDSEHGSAL